MILATTFAVGLMRSIEKKLDLGGDDFQKYARIDIPYAIRPTYLEDFSTGLHALGRGKNGLSHLAEDIPVRDSSIIPSE